jgi:hypothetical protein
LFFLRGRAKRSLSYFFIITQEVSFGVDKLACGVIKLSFDRWHSRLGHPSIPIVLRVIRDFNLPCLALEINDSVCGARQQAKSHQLPYPTSTSVSKFPLELVFSDVWGSAPESVGRYKYYVSFIDNFSKFTWIYLIKFKSEVFQKFHEFQALVERLFDRKIVAMQTDWGGEYEKLNSFFNKIGITHLVSCPHAHQQNGAAERKHRHIVEVGLSFLAQAHMSLKYWDEAFLAATFLINRTPSKVINYSTPLEHLFKVKPNFQSFQIFGCACWPHLRPFNTHKLEFRSKECAFLGYSNKHKGFKCLDLSTGHTYISRDVIFDENAFPFSKLRPDAGPRLRVEISLLPPTLVHTSHGGDLVLDHMTNTSNSTDPGARLQSPQVPTTNNSTEESTIPGADLLFSPSSRSAPEGAPTSTSILGPVPTAVHGPPAVTSMPGEYVPAASGPAAPESGEAAAHESGEATSGPVLGFSAVTGSTALPTAVSSLVLSSSTAEPPRARLQGGIRKPKVYHDGTIHYGCRASTDREPSTITEALSDENWKIPMNNEIDALMKNKTWHLVPPRSGRNGMLLTANGYLRSREKLMAVLIDIKLG